MNTTELPLRDIHLPEPVSWWPMAMGWWLCVGTLLLAGVLLAWWWRGAPSRRARRAALGELTTIENDYASHGDGHACAQGLSRLLRRLALLAGEPCAAHSRGESLHSVLAGLSKTHLPLDVLDVVRDAPYSPAAATAIDAARYRAATASLRGWLKRLRVPRQTTASAPHAAV